MQGALRQELHRTVGDEQVAVVALLAPQSMCVSRSLWSANGRTCRIGPWPRSCVLGAMMLASIVASSRVHADDVRRHFDIDSQPTAGALNEFARQADVTLAFAATTVADRRSAALHGDYTVVEALRRLLDGTSLSFRQIDDTTIAIKKPQSNADPPPATDAGAADQLPSSSVLPSGGGSINRNDKLKGNSTMNRRSFGSRVASLLAAVGAVFAGGGAHAQSTDDNAVPVLKEIIVTGTAGGAEMRKQDASYAITTLSAEQISAAAPKSSAELLKQVPGVWVESSGGVAGANINVIGFPEAGDAPHVTLAINGAPLYGTESLSFLEQSSMFRVDETIGTVESVLGGPGAVFGKGEPGLTTNFRLKEGSEETKGLVKYTGSDYNLNRVDALLSGELADNLYYMVGGYVSSSPGIRDAQFLSEKGRQFTVNITKKLDYGKIGLWTRMTDDHGQWLLPMFSKSGNDLGTFSQLGDYTRQHRIQVGQDGNGDAIYQTFDFGNGRGWSGSVSGLNAEFNTSDNTVLRDNLSFTTGDADTYGFVPDGGALQVSALGLAPGAVTTLTSNQTLGPNDWVQEYGYWVVKKHIRSFTNDISLNIKFGDINDLTLGYYAAQWSVNEWWSLNNPAPVWNVAHGDLLNNAVTCQSLAAAGSGASCFNYAVNAAGDSTANAFYVADSYHATDALRFDAGVRYERQTLDYWLDTNDGAYSYPDGTVNQVVPHATGSKFSFTGAADYAFSDDRGVYARYTKGYSFPNFDSFRGGNGSAAVQAINEAEAGYKYTGSMWKLFATGFWNKTDATGGVVGSAIPSQTFTSRAYGLVVDGGVRVSDLTLDVSATFQHAIYTASSANPAQVDKKVERQPDVRIMLTPSYDVPFGGWTATVYGAIAYIGSRPADQDNTFFFDSYTTIDAGVKLETPWQWSMEVHGENLTNRHDATEGDPRNSVAGNYRPILGRSVQFSLNYKFD